MKKNYFTIVVFGLGLVLGSFGEVLEFKRLIVVTIGFGVICGTILGKIKELEKLLKNNNLK